MAGRTTLIMGGVQADVSLVKASSAPSAAKWETKTVAADALSARQMAETDALDAQHADELAALDAGPALDAIAEGTPDDPFGVAPDPFGDGITRTMPVIPTTVEGARARDAQVPATKTLRGVTNDAGDFVDLTDELAAIDAQVKLPGMIVAAAIPMSAVPRERVRDASYLSPVDAMGSKVCTLLYRTLRDQQRALAVRWTKRTNQALGIIVASARHNALVLLEVEWSANMVAPSKRIQAATEVPVSDAELTAAGKFVGALSQPASALDALEDERAVLNARLLDAAREGTPADVDLTVARPDAGELDVLLGARS